MPDSELFTWLNSHHDARLHVRRVATSTLRDWVDDMDSSIRSGVRRAWEKRSKRLLAKHLLPQFPINTLTARHVREFLRIHANARTRNRRTGVLMDHRDLATSLLTAVSWWKRQGWCPNVKSLPRAPP